MARPLAGTAPPSGDTWHPSARTLPSRIGTWDVEGAIVMVPTAASADVVRQCLAQGIPRVWLHRGAGPSSVSDEAVALCREHDVPVVDGACPLMFVEPVGWIHRAHRAGRRLAGHLEG